MVVTVGIAVSVYFLIGYGNKTDDVQGAQIASCERNLAKSLILIKVIEQAAETRRVQAASETDPTASKNDLHAAETFEDYAKQFDSLTPKNCYKEVLNPTGG